MTFHKVGMKLGLAAAALAAALSMGAPAAQAAGTTVIIDGSSLADNCGAYNGKTASPDLATALAGLTGGTVVVCPGNYGGLDNALIDHATNLTIKQAVPGPENRPHFTTASPTTIYALHVKDSSNVIIDGLVIDNSQDTAGDDAIFFENSSGSVRNSVILGSATSVAMFIDAATPGVMKMVVSNDLLQGYQYGIVAVGPVTLTVLGSTLDATNGGLLAPAGAIGIIYSGRQSADARLGGMVSKNTLLNNQTGVFLDEVSKVSVTSNLMSGNIYSVIVQTRGDYRGADSNKVTANTILNVPPGGYGVWAKDTDTTAPETTIHSLTISKNRISAAQFAYSGGTAAGVYLQQADGGSELITGTASGNTFTGFSISPQAQYITAAGPGPAMTGTGNTHTP